MERLLRAAPIGKPDLTLFKERLKSTLKKRCGLGFCHCGQWLEPSLLEPSTPEELFSQRLLSQLSHPQSQNASQTFYCTGCGMRKTYTDNYSPGPMVRCSACRLSLPFLRLAAESPEEPHSSQASDPPRQTFVCFGCGMVETCIADCSSKSMTRCGACQSRSPFLDLPAELRLEIAQYLDSLSLLVLKICNKKLYGRISNCTLSGQHEKLDFLRLIRPAVPRHLLLCRLCVKYHTADPDLFFNHKNLVELGTQAHGPLEFGQDTCHLCYHCRKVHFDYMRQEYWDVHEFNARNIWPDGDFPYRAYPTLGWDLDGSSQEDEHEIWWEGMGEDYIFDEMGWDDMLVQ